MIRINKEWRATQLSKSLINNRIANRATALSLSIAALGFMGMSTVNAAEVPLPIKKIGLNNDNQIVVYFGKRDGEFPTPPHLLDTPGPNHRVIIEFADALVDKVNMPGAADLSTKLHKQLFGIKSIRYQTINVGDATRAQVVIELAEQLKVRPRVVKLEEDSVTINLSDDIVEQSAVLEGPVKGRSRSRVTSMHSSQSEAAEAGAPTMIAQNDSKPEIPTPSNSDADPDVTVTSSRSSSKSIEVATAAPSAVQSLAPVASAVSAMSSTPVGSAGDGMPALRTAPIAMAAESKPATTSASANAAESKNIDDESSSQVAESMPSSPKTKAAPNSKIPELKMPETLTNAGANLKKFMHWPHKDDAMASASPKDSSSSSSSTTSAAGAKKSSSTTAVDKQATSQTTAVAAAKSDVKVAAAKETKKEVKKEVVDLTGTTGDSDATEGRDGSQSKLSKLNLFAKLPRPGFIKPKSPDVVAAAHVNTSKPTKNTVVDAGFAGDSSNKSAIESSSAASAMPVADAANGDAAPEGAEFNAAFANQSSSATVKTTSSLAAVSAPTPSSASTLASAPTPSAISSSDNAPAPGSWDWTANASKPVKQTAVSTSSALTSASSGDVVVSKATNTLSEVAETGSTRPVQIAQDMPADDRPKISTPIETTETQTFSQPAQMLTPGSSTSVSQGAQEMMKIKAKEQEVKPVTVADTEKIDFAAAMKSTPTKKQKVDEAAANEPTLIRDTEMADPAVEKTATKMPAETEAPAGEMPAQVTPETNTAAAAASEPEAPIVDKNKLATAKYNDAVKAHLSGKLPEAIAAYKEALAANPGLAEAHSNLGLIYNQQHKYEMAVSEFQKALAVNPKDAITYNGIGAALRAQKDLIGAIKNFQTAVSLDPKLATAHYNLGVAYELQRDYDRSLNSYEQAIKCDYRLGEAYYRMGMILEKRHRIEDARVKFKAALKASENADYSADARQRLALLESKPTR